MTEKKKFFSSDRRGFALAASALMLTSFLTYNWVAEALDGEPPDASFDLWSLCIVLYECVLGKKVFSSTEPRQTMVRIRMGRIPDFAQVCPEYGPSLGEFFRESLHRSRNRRPATALELQERLREVRAKLG